MKNVGYATLSTAVLLALSLSPLQSARPERAILPVGTLVAGRDIISPRAGHTASLLPDGKILIAGGRSSQGRSAEGRSAEGRPAKGAVLATTEIYDPTTETFAPGFQMKVAREDHIAMILGNGTTLIAGGRSSSGAALAGSEDYDFENAKSSYRGNMHARRIRPTATMLLDGRVLLTGGEDGTRALDSAETYSVLNGTWTLVGRMTAARAYHTATLLADGRVLLAGGTGLKHEALASAEIFDPHTNKFTAAGNLHEARFGHTAGRLLNGKILLAGGSRGSFAGYTATSTAASSKGEALKSAEIFQPDTSDFISTGALSQPHPAALSDAPSLLDGQVLVIGGATLAEIFDARSGTFRHVTGAFDASRSRSAAVQLGDGSVRIFGGADDKGVSTAKTWIYRP